MKQAEQAFVGGRCTLRQRGNKVKIKTRKMKSVVLVIILLHMVSAKASWLKANGFHWVWFISSDS